ncbi:hypothetical protein [Spirosoma pomorum]
MNNDNRPILPRQRRLTPVMPIPVSKKPYLVRGTPDTILYLTPEQAASRIDLIPQFMPARLP